MEDSVEHVAKDQFKDIKDAVQDLAFQGHYCVKTSVYNHGIPQILTTEITKMGLPLVIRVGIVNGYWTIDDSCFILQTPESKLMPYIDPHNGNIPSILRDNQMACDKADTGIPYVFTILPNSQRRPDRLNLPALSDAIVRMLRVNAVIR